MTIIQTVSVATPLIIPPRTIILPSSMATTPKSLLRLFNDVQYDHKLAMGSSLLISNFCKQNTRSQCENIKITLRWLNCINYLTTEIADNDYFFERIFWKWSWAWKCM